MDIPSYPVFNSLPMTGPATGPIRTITDIATGVKVTLAGPDFRARVQVSNAAPGHSGMPHLFLPPEDSWDTVATVVPNDPPVDLMGPLRYVRVVLESGTLTGGNIAESRTHGNMYGTPPQLRQELLGIVEEGSGHLLITPEQAAQVARAANAEQLLSGALADIAQTTDQMRSVAGIYSLGRVPQAGDPAGSYRVITADGAVDVAWDGTAETGRTPAIATAQAVDALAVSNRFNTLAELSVWDRGGTLVPVAFVGSDRFIYRNAATVALVPDIYAVDGAMVISAAGGGIWERQVTGSWRLDYAEPLTSEAGVSDNDMTAKFSKMILKALALGRKTLEFPEGRYSIQGDLPTFTRSMELRGAGKNKTVLVFTGAKGIEFARDLGAITIRDMTLACPRWQHPRIKRSADGGKTLTAYGPAVLDAAQHPVLYADTDTPPVNPFSHTRIGIAFRGVQDDPHNEGSAGSIQGVTLQNVSLDGWATAIWMNRTWNVNMAGVDTVYCGRALAAYGKSVNCHVTRCHLGVGDGSGSLPDGRTPDTTTVLIRGEDWGNPAAPFLVGTEGWVFTNNLIVGGMTQFELDACSHTRIMHNIIDFSGIAGVVLNTLATYPSLNNVVCDNFIGLNCRSGVAGIWDNNTVFTHAQMRGGTYSRNDFFAYEPNLCPVGVLATADGARYTSIQGNTFIGFTHRDIQGGGVWLEQIVEGNRCISTTDDGVNIQGGTYVKNNVGSVSFQSFTRVHRASGMTYTVGLGKPASGNPYYDTLSAGERQVFERLTAYPAIAVDPNPAVQTDANGNKYKIWEWARQHPAAGIGWEARVRTLIGD